MKNQVKVTKTENHKDSQKGDTIVCRGRLIFISKFKDNESKFDFSQSYLIISETEETIGCESPIMRAFDNAILIDNVNSDNRRGEKFYKILALPENFSDKQIDAIVDGKLKDGDDVLLECTVKDREEWMGDNETGEPFMMEDYFIKLNKDNHITLMPAKKEFTEAEQEAIRRFQNGEKWSCSSFIDEDTIVAGYGQLDHKSNPYDFEFPLPTVYIKAIYGSTSWNMATRKEKEIDMLNRQVAELLSLKRSINESKLKEYFPKREMSFHDKVVLAIDSATTYNIDSIREFGKHVGYSSVMTEEYIKSLSQENYNPPTRK